MIPNKTNPKWEALVKGEITPNFRVFSGNMMLSLLSRSIQKDSSEKNIRQCINQAYDYFVRFEKLFGTELNNLFK